MKLLILTQHSTDAAIILRADSFVTAIDRNNHREVYYRLVEGIRLSYLVKETIYEIECQLKETK